MTGAEFIRRVRRLGRKRGVGVRFDPSRGVGSHGTLWYGDRYTVVKNRKKELGKGLVGDMLKQIGLGRDDLG